MPPAERVPSSQENLEEYVRRFRSLDRMDLVEAWENPMPAAAREHLLAEIRRRGYRIKSLPKPPSPEEASVVVAPQIESIESKEERGARRVKAGLRWLLLLGLMHLIVGTIVGYFQFQTYAASLSSWEGLPDSELVELGGKQWPVEKGRVVARLAQVLGFAIPVGIGIVLLLLYGWARVAPRPALITAFVALFVVYTLETVFTPVLIFTLGLRLFILVSLLLAIRAARRDPLPEEDVGWGQG